MIQCETWDAVEIGLTYTPAVGGINKNLTSQEIVDD